MKLDTSHMRYLTTDDFRVLQAVEQGSRSHEVVPTPLIHQISGMRSQSGTNRAISDLAKLSLISKMRNVKYDGYRLTYNGIDYLALKTMLNRDTVYSVGNTIGVGKESDIYKVSDKNGNPRVMKIHRLGRTSFHSVRNNRDYLKKSNQGANWMHLSRLAANKEYQFMSMLYSKGFKVPEPFDNSRHIVVMELIEGYPMRRLRKHKNIPKLYSDLMCFIVDLANSGLIHCDFNEFNIMIKDKLEDENDCGFVVIDFPQCISIQHQDADYYFQRDVDCIRRFFKKKLKYEPKPDSSMLDTEGFGDGYKYAYPDFKRDVKRTDNLDELVQASGFSKKHPGDRGLETAVESMRNAVYNSDDDMSNDEAEEENGEGDYSEEDEYYDSELDNESSEDDSEDAQEEENERIIEALSSGVENLKMDKLGNYILE
ncbi:ADI_G0051090.mRNA.1.CDS.1 [Saccharomyces cerevisiae]|mgnify:FL=1|uniref:Serine/threonine-protein kinase RIO2 n=8 Tax=Saccharomyces TaxID=4930 RepID=RIO2_YEAST|nr:protein kinase RIO2 [Saccharomyces cerevisiae S288C]P40160.1 RecName: Full=Serine/threonine-protein kinase RIO2 [Saccharomyces cerevisiae S288C]6EML_r Chain r, Serine/threonine-protein kinase RIO2 [Saccharomyces cerevisiae S288C]6FAI_l Chain l, Serine/threonine-protein kinase RIO2 [Saccharomyces cerevisiae S288C]6RBD_l Chain l, Serine/threonine-protein kinase RIO2 [Saccharomyces cerevisiae S288C]6Y7C_l Chain l, Serine/threonine-protein kinase RIO2 [Saccharomyces cerevisiae S288C]8C00_r Cha|eukprot:NP_014192.1 protein kinase RIO2 [Saccharomyces cerevisiae S288C]